MSVKEDADQPGRRRRKCKRTMDTKIRAMFAWQTEEYIAAATDYYGPEIDPVTGVRGDLCQIQADAAEVLRTLIVALACHIADGTDPARRLEGAIGCGVLPVCGALAVGLREAMATETPA